jgi:hypothetical protein
MGYEVTHYKIKINEASPSLIIRYKKDNLAEIKHCVGSVVCAIKDPLGVIQCAPFIPSGASQANQVAACIHRFGRKMPTPRAERAKDFERYAREFIVKAFKPVTSGDIPTFDEWLEDSGYPGPRREELRHVRDEMTKIGEKDCVNKSFIKWESYMELKQPRAINSYTDEIKVYLGRFVKAVDKATFRNRWFVKGDDPKYRPNKLMDMFGLNPVFCTDFSSFEAHHSGVYARVVRFWMMHMLRCSSIDRHVKSLVSRLMLGQNTCKFGTITAKVDQRLMSGALWTSSSNGVLNLLIMSYIYAKSMGGDVETGLKFKGLFEGDDGIFESFNADRSLIEEMGLKLDFDRHENFSTASFCGVCCVPGKNVNTTDPKKVLRNFFVLPKQYNGAKDSTKWMLLRAKALSYKYLYNDCPIVGPLVDRVCDLTRSYNVSSQRAELDWYKRQVFDRACESKVWLQRPQILEETRDVVSKSFGIDRYTQIQIEDAIGKWDGGDLQIPAIYGYADYKHADDFLVDRPIRYPAIYPMARANGKTMIRDRKIDTFHVAPC